MNIHDPTEVIEVMINATHDAHDIEIDVGNEMITVRALGAQNSGLTISWSYPGFGYERVRQIAAEYKGELLLRQREQGLR
jgi:hypothetical protein